MKTIRSPLPARRSAATSPIPDVAPVMTTVLPAMALADHVEFAEEEADFVEGGFDRVRTMYRIRLDGFGEILADGSGRRFRRVGCAHHLAVLRNRIFPLQHLHNHGSRTHEFDKAAEERPLLMHIIECFGVPHRKAHPFLCDDAQTRLFEPRRDFS